jgi:hypothetical protein
MLKRKIIQMVKGIIAAVIVFGTTIGGVCGGPQPYVAYAGHWQTIGSVKVCVPGGSIQCFVVEFKK